MAKRIFNNYFKQEILQLIILADFIREKTLM